jgi:hypothetical protein
VASDKTGAFGNRGVCGECLKPPYFDPHAIADQAVFREMDAQVFDLGGIAAV